MTWHISEHRLILIKSQPLTGHSPFQRETERIRIPKMTHFHATCGEILFTPKQLLFLILFFCFNIQHPFRLSLPMQIGVHHAALPRLPPHHRLSSSPPPGWVRSACSFFFFLFSFFFHICLF